MENLIIHGLGQTLGMALSISSICRWISCCMPYSWPKVSASKQHDDCHWAKTNGGVHSIQSVDMSALSKISLPSSETKEFQTRAAFQISPKSQAPIVASRAHGTPYTNEAPHIRWRWLFQGCIWKIHLYGQCHAVPCQGVYSNTAALIDDFQGSSPRNKPLTKKLKTLLTGKSSTLPLPEDVKNPCAQGRSDLPLDTCSHHIPQKICVQLNEKSNTTQHTSQMPAKPGYQ